MSWDAVIKVGAAVVGGTVVTGICGKVAADKYRRKKAKAEVLHRLSYDKAYGEAIKDAVKEETRSRKAKFVEWMKD